ncbi:MAG: type II secretion system protein [Kiritimatiellae bacterium]|nr:type II secretion system protein [Kiritimatiellia bacterium]
MFTQRQSSGADAPASRTAGFSLVELLVALSIVILVTPAILAIIPRSFDALVAARSRSASARALAAFDASFDRDFASIVVGCGFSGDSSSCSFWTLRPAASGGFSPVLVEYRGAGGHVSRTDFPLPLYTALCGTNAPSATPPDFTGQPPSLRPDVTLFALNAAQFRYFAPAPTSSQTPAPPAAPAPADFWLNPTNVPAGVELSLAPASPPTPSQPDGAALQIGLTRFFFRRGAP